MAVSRRRGVTAGEPAGATARERDRGVDPDRKGRGVGSTVGTAVGDRAGAPPTVAAPQTARKPRAKHRSGGAAPMKAMKRREGNDKTTEPTRKRVVEVGVLASGGKEPGKKAGASQRAAAVRAAAEVREWTAVVGEISGQ